MNFSSQHLYFGRVAIAFAATVGFFLLSLYVRTWTEHNVFPLLFPPVVLSAWIGGRAAGLFSTLALSVGALYYHLPPQGSFLITDADDLVRLGTFTVSGAFVAWLSGALKESQVTLLATLKSIGDAVIATDRRGTIRFLNPSAEGLTGWRQKDAEGQSLREVFQGVDEKTGATFRVPPETLGSIPSLPASIHLTSKSGEQLFVDDSLAPVTVDSGRTLGWILVFRDATTRRQNEAALVKSERERLQAQRMETIGRFAGGVAHDFNNLLTVMNGYADVVLKQLDSGSEAHSGVERIRKAGEQAASLTRQLLVFGRGRPMNVEVADLNHVVANFEGTLRRLIGEDIELITRLEGQPLYVKVDVTQIVQVIMNLAVNARDAMPGGGRLTLETGTEAANGENSPLHSGEPAGEYAVLIVKDTGGGIAPDAKEHLFEPFFTTKEVGKGTGLGLAIIHSIVERHGGHIRVASELGSGSTFSVCLPRTAAPPTEARPPESGHEIQRGGATILLVEDNQEVRHLMREILAGAGYIVLEAAQAEEAIRAAENHPASIELLVSDIVMPGLNGVDLAKRLAPIQPRMKVLFVSGYSTQVADAVERSGSAAEYLQKPFGPVELERKVAEMISRQA